MQDDGSEGYGAQLCQVTPTERRGEGHTFLPAYSINLHHIPPCTYSVSLHSVNRHTGLVYILHLSLHMALVHTMSLPAQGLYRILPCRQLASWLLMLLLMFLPA